jgi:hypothetical protein
MYRKSDECLFGLKLFDIKGNTLLSCGQIDNENCRSSDNAVLKRFSLLDGEQLIGFMSCSMGEHRA